MGMRARKEERAEKDGGSSVGGKDNGRKPLGSETVNGASLANSLSSVGMVVRRGNVGGAAREPIVNADFISVFLLGLFREDDVFCVGYV